MSVLERCLLFASVVTAAAVAGVVYWRFGLLPAVVAAWVLTLIETVVVCNLDLSPPPAKASPPVQDRFTFPED